MTKKPKIPSGLPTKAKLVEFIRSCETPPSKSEIAKAFHIRGEDDRIVLKDMLRELKKEGVFGRKRQAASEPLKSGKKAKLSSQVVILRVTGYNPSGQLQAKPLDSEQPLFSIQYRDGEAPKPGDEIMAKIDEQRLQATALRIMPPRLTHILGVFHSEGTRGWVESTNRKIQEEFTVPTGMTKDAEDGELVYCKLLDNSYASRKSLRAVKILERVGRMDQPKSASLIAIQNQDIPMEFSAEAIRIAEKAKPPVMTLDRADLRNYALVTIDGADARDFDDAVWAEPWENNGWHLLVAIADVAHYVRFGTALDNEAFERGNSVYFPDRVVPMLPEALSNGLCSLNPNEDRYCLAVHLWIDVKGETQKYEFVRGLMRSCARLTYDQVQAAHDGEPNVIPQGILEKVIEPLYGVYKTLDKRRQQRGALDLDLPEHKVAIDPVSGKVTSIAIRERFDSHKLIEECMIAANVAAANAIQKAAAPGMFRVHETPDFERVMNLRHFLKQMGYKIVKEQNISPHHFNEVLNEAHDKPEAHVIHMAILRSQMAAFYHPKNLGHFGLSLEEYCHFTSPIRRYSDLIVHRTLIDIINNMPDSGISTSKTKREAEGMGGYPHLPEDGLTLAQAENLNSIATHISQTERRAMLAEREARERYITSYMADKVGKEFEAVIASVNSFGFFAELRENGAQGLVPLRSLGGDFWIFEKEQNQIIGRRTGEIFHLGQRLRVVLVEANTLTGSMQFGLVGREAAGAFSKKRQIAPRKRDKYDDKNSFADKKKKPSYRKLEKKRGKRYSKK